MSSKNYCSKCHNELPGDGSYCPNCKMRIGKIREMTKEDLKIIQDKEKRKKAFRKKQLLEQKPERDRQTREANEIYRLKKNFNHIENLSDKYKKNHYPNFIKKLLAPIRIKRLKKALNQAYRDNKHDLACTYVKLALVDIGKPSIQPMIKALKDEKENIRCVAARVLAEVGDERAINPLIDALKDEKPRVREMAAFALTYIGGKRALKPLTQALDDNNLKVKEQAHRGIDRIQYTLLKAK
ncbi:HEAT repeat domain-containing protein [Candidatus Neomarinimicrobiota bacterium]